jgi:cytidylate kinase
VAPLRAAEDAETVNTTGLDIEQVLEALLEVVHRRSKEAGGDDLEDS